MPPAISAACMRRRFAMRRGCSSARTSTRSRDAGAFDGILGVVIGIMLVDMLEGERLPFSIEVVGFSEEEGVRFGVPFIGSRALAGTL